MQAALRRFFVAVVVCSVVTDLLRSKIVDLALLLHFCRGPSSSCKAGTACKGVVVSVLSASPADRKMCRAGCGLGLQHAADLSKLLMATSAVVLDASKPQIYCAKAACSAGRIAAGFTGTKYSWVAGCLLQVHPCQGGFQHTCGSRSTANSLHTKLVAGLQLSVQLAAPLPAQTAQNLVVTDSEHAADTGVSHSTGVLSTPPTLAI